MSAAATSCAASMPARTWFLPSKVIEPAVFAALEAEVRTLDMSGVADRAGEQLGKAPAVAEHKRKDIQRKAPVGRLSSRDR